MVLIVYGIFFKFYLTVLLKNQFFSHLMILQPPHAVCYCTMEAQLLCWFLKAKTIPRFMGSFWHLISNTSYFLYWNDEGEKLIYDLFSHEVKHSNQLFQSTYFLQVFSQMQFEFYCSFSKHWAKSLVFSYIRVKKVDLCVYFH